MSRLFSTLLIILNISSACAQKLQSSIWQHSKEDYIYQVYLKDQLLEITDYVSASYPEGGITLSSNYYGFYNSCEIPHIDSLKSSGPYYFEISDIEINDAGKIEGPIRCLELNIFKEDEDTSMNIYDSYHQQFSTYQKLKKLPKNLEDYLKKEHPEMYEAYQELVSSQD